MIAYLKINAFYTSIGFWLILGVECYTAWSKCTLTVYPGESVTIPCHYDMKYTQQRKYWFSEINTKNTYTNTTEQNLSVIDHPDQSLFTVTMRNLQNKHTAHYYCVVETGEQPPMKVIYEPYLKIQSTPDVSVVSSSVSGHEGSNISVQCLYSSGYQNKVKQWCRYKDQSCYTVGRTDTSQNSSVQISDDGRKSFTVLMTGLRLTDSGWYFCSAGEVLNPVQLTVTHAERGTLSEKVSETGILKNINKTEVTEEPNLTVFTKIRNNLLTVLISALATLLLLLILVGVFTWRWRRKPKQDKHQIRGRNCSTTTEAIYSKPEDPVIYSTINDENPRHPNKDITYSTTDHVPGSKPMKPPAVIWENLQTSDSGYYWCAVEIGGSIDDGYRLYLTVQSDGDISVECFYSPGYKDKPKQWCRIKEKICYTVGSTDTSENSPVQIIDDGKRSFTVLMTGLRLTDSGWYCCSVGDLQVPVHLMVTEPKRAASETVNSEIHSTDEQNKHDVTLVMFLPVMLVLLLLVTLVAIVTLRLRKKPGDVSALPLKQDKTETGILLHISVQWENLQTSDSGYYWCAVEIGDYSKTDDSYHLYLRVQSAVSLDMKVVISEFSVSTVLDIRIKSNGGADIKIRAVTQWGRLAHPTIHQSRSLMMGEDPADDWTETD
ncbi:hypothetical protein QQF64_015611 [Cirrhinus molitorella]|uniref:Ig-like domain-containing protein n=1 Tax=Cirrhinus molitorella TaxID=172907 RepID=A0ABR3NW65_9TELE